MGGGVTWDELASHRPAWDLLVWLSILFGMCTALAEMGVIKWVRCVAPKTKKMLVDCRQLCFHFHSRPRPGSAAKTKTA